MNNYEIGQLIDQGGMGAVYRGRHVALERDVAIKFILPHVASDAAAVERFLREARLAARINHPNVVHVYDTGVDEQGRPYIVMELLSGEPLKERLMRGPMTEADCVEIGKQVLSALDKAHSMSVIHRDIKPGNIFLCDDRLAKILDFGVAKGLDAGNVTLAGKTVGSPAYMSPEQAEGNSVDWRTDLYSIGIVMYEMLMGRVPFTGENSFAIMQKHLSTPPPPLPSTVNSQLRAIIEKALAKNPDKRYANAAEMRAALEKVPARNVIVAAPAPDAPSAHNTPPPANSPTVSGEPVSTKRSSALPFVLVGILALLVGGGIYAVPKLMKGQDGPPGPFPATGTTTSTGTNTGTTSSGSSDSITTEEERKTEPIPFKTEPREDASLAQGATKVLVTGVNGEKEVIYEVKKRNGVEFERTKKDERVVRDPINQVVLVGKGAVEPETRTQQVTKEETIRFGTTTKTDRSMAPGTTKVVQEGENGLKTVVYELTYKGDKLVDRKQISSNVTKKPVQRIVAKGPAKIVERGWICSYCGKRRGPNQKFCPDDGTPKP